MRIGSLCSGYGGLEMGVQAVIGGSVAWHVEYDADPSKILAHHWPDVPNHGNVKTTDWSQVEPVEVLTAGYPCQPFSHAGNRKGSDDPRHLWPDVAGAIGALRPRLVVLENVRGHVSLGLDAVIGDLSALGYDARWRVVRAADAGAPHGRARIFITARPNASRHGRDEGWAEPTRQLGGSEAAVLVGAAATDAEDDRRSPRIPGRPTAEQSRSAGDSRPTPTETGSGPLPRTGTAGDGLRLVAERGDLAAPDSGESGRQGRGGSQAGEPDAGGGVRAGTTSGPPSIAWGQYEPAIRRWERLTRPAPAPTELGAKSQPRLSPRFVEWLMGLPAGHVTDAPISRNAQLKALGNGVVPQQAALALGMLLDDALVGAA